MPDELTLGELGRTLSAKFADLKDDIRDLSAQLSAKVDVQVLLLQQQAQDERHNALKSQVDALQKQRTDDAQQLQKTRRWLIGMIVVPLLAVLLPLLVTRGKL